MVRLALPLVLALLPLAASAQEKPYFVTYDHHLEEPGSLEISVSPMLGLPKSGSTFVGSTLEFGYGVKGWWTTELYLDGQSTRRDTTIFTGWKWENRFRPLLREHWINPVIYIEYVDVNGADKTIKEVVGFDSTRDFADPNRALRLAPRAQARDRNQAHPLELLPRLESFGELHRGKEPEQPALGIWLRRGLEPPAGTGRELAQLLLLP